jgi:uncharacterized protein YndB with AHSA1/START domain
MSNEQAQTNEIPNGQGRGEPVTRRVHLTASRTLAAPVSAVWAIVSGGAGVERWFEWVARTDLRDGAEGGLRIIHMKDGSRFDEHITLNDARTLTYQYYAPRPPLPIHDVIGTKRLEPMAGGGVRLSWFVGFEPAPDAPVDIARQMLARYENALQKIEEVALAGA